MTETGHELRMDLGHLWKRMENADEPDDIEETDPET